MAKLIIKDEVNIKIEGLDLDTRKKLSNKFKYTLAYAKHHPAYKLGRWDGTTTLFSLAGAGYLNQLERILPILENNNIDITEVIDHRAPFNFKAEKVTEAYWADRGYVWPVGHEFEGLPVMLRDYQLQIVNDCIEHPQSINVACTGSGKTLVCATLAHLCQPYGKTLTIVPSKSLVEQTEEAFVNVGLDVGVYYGDRKNLDATHIISTWQSLEILNKNSKKDIDAAIKLAILLESIVAVIADECHQVKANVLHSLLTKNLRNTPLRWGLTGTMPKDECDYESIYVAIGEPVGMVSANDLQEKGVLANCHISIYQLHDYKEFKDYPSENKWLTTNEERIKFISSIIQTISTTGNTLVLVNRIDTGKMLAELLNVEFISGSVKTKIRKQEYDTMKTCNNKITIASFGVASVGLNIIRVHNLVLLEPGKSFVRVIQSIGRGLRKGLDKDFVEIYDITSTCKFSKKHLTERKRYYKEVKYNFSINKIDWQ